MTQLAADTVAKLTSLHDELSSEVASLQSDLLHVQSVEVACAAAQLTMEELLTMKDIVFPGLPDVLTTQARLSKLQTALSGIDKLLAP